MRLHVLKIGGSLLDLPDVGQRVQRILASSRSAGRQPLLIVGGGAAADVVRNWDAVHGLSDTGGHWIAVDSLRVTAGLLSELLGDTAHISQRSELADRIKPSQTPILDCPAFLRSPEGRRYGDWELPSSWRVTSDSIAAWVSLVWQAEHLTLVKSADLPESCDARAAATAGLIDEHFATLVAHPDFRTRLSWCNARQGALALQPLGELFGKQ